MKKLFLLAFLIGLSIHVSAQNVSVSKARFQRGDDPNWAKPELNDASWSEIDMTRNWDKQGYVINQGYGWYRARPWRQLS